MPRIARPPRSEPNSSLSTNQLSLPDMRASRESSRWQRANRNLRPGAQMRRGWMLAELPEVARREIAHVPEAVRQRDLLDLQMRRAGEQLTPGRPQAAQPKVTLQAHVA